MEFCWSAAVGTLQMNRSQHTSAPRSKHTVKAETNCSLKFSNRDNRGSLIWTSSHTTRWQTIDVCLAANKERSIQVSPQTFCFFETESQTVFWCLFRGHSLWTLFLTDPCMRKQKLSVCMFLSVVRLQPLIAQNPNTTYRDKSGWRSQVRRTERKRELSKAVQGSSRHSRDVKLFFPVAVTLSVNKKTWKLVTQLRASCTFALLVTNEHQRCETCIGCHQPTQSILKATRSCLARRTWNSNVAEAIN